MRPSRPTATGYTGRLASYERGLGRLLWTGLLATLVWLGT